MKPKKINWYRGMRHAQEKRMYYAHKDLVHIRGKRTPSVMIDPWDDKPGCVQKTWKVKRNKQYRNRSTQTKHTVILNVSADVWKLQEYLDKHDISYRLEEIRESTTSSRYKMKQVKDKLLPHYIYKYEIVDGKFTKKIKHQAGFTWIYKWVINYDLPKTEYHYSYITHYVLTYWTNKNIDLSFIWDRK